MEAIYTIYANNLGWEQNNERFALICTLCNHYEERAFKEGLQLGAQLILELQDKKQKKNAPYGTFFF